MYQLLCQFSASFYAKLNIFKQFTITKFDNQMFKMIKIQNFNLLKRFRMTKAFFEYQRMSNFKALRQIIANLRIIQFEVVDFSHQISYLLYLQLKITILYLFFDVLIFYTIIGYSKYSTKREYTLHLTYYVSNQYNLLK